MLNITSIIAFIYHISSPLGEIEGALFFLFKHFQHPVGNHKAAHHI